jgi:hypothetical protein
LRNGVFKGLHFKDIDNLSFEFISDKGCLVNNLHTALKSAQNDTVQARFFLERAGCDFVNKEMVVEDLHFQVPVENLGWLSENLQQSFPGIVTPPVADLIKGIKQEGEVNGNLRLAISEPHCAMRMTLADGLYRLMDKEHDLSGFTLICDPYGIKLHSEYHFRHHTLWLEGYCSAPAFDSGELVISDLIAGVPSGQQRVPLTVHWKIDPLKGYYIEKMQGYLSGMNVDVLRDPEMGIQPDSLHFVGKVDVDVRQAKTFCEESLASKISGMDIGSGYTFKGKWRIGKDQHKNMSEGLTFQGDLLGQDFEFFGYQFYNMNAQMTYSKDVVNVYNMRVTDPCGAFQIDKLSMFDQGDGNWQAVVPLLSITEFRPSLMKTTNGISQKMGKSLVIQEMVVQDLYGTLGNPRSFKGYGRLDFANPPKNNIQHPLFAIPAEILTRIGLDLSVLTPVKGSIYYDIRDSKVWLTRFKDVYSKGRMSKFYLPNNGSQSYVDFDGNLHMQVRMKQYNLIFKLAELFTVTVQGTIKKPTYTLTKQQKQEEDR